MKDNVDTIADLESCVGKRPPAVDQKVIDHLDAEALTWLVYSPLAFVALGSSSDIALTLAGGKRGFAAAPSSTCLQLPLDAIDDPDGAREGASFGALFLIPGVGETLRINGVVQAVSGGSMMITVQECFLHCAKALIRSAFWEAQPAALSEQAESSHLAASRLLVVATLDAQGNADVSPKGDPAGLLLQWQQNQLCYADRPGNRRTDSFRNMLSNPKVALAVLVPGSTQVLSVTGHVNLSRNTSMREAFSVNGKMPNLVTGVSPESRALAVSSALQQAQLWPAAPAPQDINPAAIFAAHVKLNKARGLQAGIVRRVASVPGLMDGMLRQDYKRNLY